MKNICEVYNKEYSDLPVKVLQFGEGNFLRSFADWYIDKANAKGVFNGRVCIAQPINQGMAGIINSQNSFYTVILKGRFNGEVVNSAERISSVSHCINPFENYDELLDIAVSDDLKVIISNTTEAGIAYNDSDLLDDVPNVTYPAKLTALLYERFKAGKDGLLILPVELIEKNGYYLKKYVLQYAEKWNLSNEFIDYINIDCKFCSTLVDRIVTGFPRADYDKICSQLGYEDKIMSSCEPFNCWVIEGKKEWSSIFPIHQTGLNVIWCDDMTHYRTRKVRILNGAHTMSVLAAYHMGYDIVRDMMHDELMNSFIKKGLFEQIIPTIDLPKEELDSFANSVLERFDNPYIDHRLLDISLNSVSKFKARCLCSLIDYYNKFDKLPNTLCFALAALLNFYNGSYKDGAFVGVRNGQEYVIKDSKEVTDYFEQALKSDDYVKSILKNQDFWGLDLTTVEGLYDSVKKYYCTIVNSGVKSAVEKVMNNE